jgi:4-hydroxybenzoate polyprenyltransferase
VQKLLGYLRLMRLANIVTAISDILAGVTIAHFSKSILVTQDTTAAGIPQYYHAYDTSAILLLVISTIGLYGGGVVFNDVFDAELDKIERPERPIPSGLISKSFAALLGGSLLLLGIVAAAFVHEDFFSLSFMLALAIAIAALLYDKWSKHHAIIGPLNMGLCRGLNLLLGMSIFPEVIAHCWIFGLVPVIYIAAITMISRGEVHGGRKVTLTAAAILYALVVAAIATSAVLNHTIVYASGFLLLFAVFIYPPLLKAMKDPRGPLIGKAVKAGVISLIIMNASWAAAFGNLSMALIILILLPVSIWISKAFAVT